MKRKFINCLIILVSISLFPSCNKDEEEIPEPVNNPSDCIVKDFGTIDEELFWSAEYTGGKLAKVTYYESGSINEITTYTYDGDTLRIKNTDGNLVERISRKIKIGSNGLAENETMIETALTHTGYDTITYTYNSDGYLIEKSNNKENVSTTPYKATIVTSYVITEGNITSEAITEGGITKTSTFQYYLDRENKSQLDLIGFPDFGVTIFGKRSKNEVKKITNDYNSHVESLSYSYDSNGYVIKEVFSYIHDNVSGSVEGKFNYTCQ